MNTKKTLQPIPRSLWKNPLYFIAFGFGSGAVPKAPGTAGTVVGVLFYLVMQDLPLTYYIILVVLFFIFGCYICGITEKAIGVKDYSGIVWDEVVGYLVGMIHAPRGWFWVLIGFVLFRLFDVLKPWPIKLVERYLQGGFSVMLDDVLAAVPVFLIIQLSYI